MENGIDVEGIEISEEAIDIGFTNGISYHVYNGSVLDMPFSTKKYEGIYCFNVLHLFKMEDRKNFIRKCHDQIVDGGVVFFAAFSENEPSFGKGIKIEENTFESKVRRPVHYFTDADIRNHFSDFHILGSGLIEDREKHGEEGDHTHILRYIVAKKRKSHEFDGTKYRDASSHQREWGQKLISGLKLHGSESILDLGCGDGTLTKILSENVPNGNTLGIDASERMISVAKEFETNRLTFIKMNIADIKFTDEFNLIFSNATLHWIKNHSNLLSNCYAALKLNGSIRFNFAGDGNCSNFFSVVKEVMSMDQYRQNFINFDWPWYMPSLLEYQQLLGDSEFKDLVIWAEDADRNFINSGEMIKWIEQPSFLPFLAQLDTEKKIFFRNDVVDKMIAKTMQKDGTCFETFRRINVHAIKR